MDAALEAIREQQKQSWNKFSAGWKKWDKVTMNFMLPVGEAIISALRPSGNDVVLDIAAGTGEPGLTIASMLDGGKVVITDLAEDMLTIAKENATLRNIKNVDIISCDVCELPFADDSFDAISCRFGFMFFPDMQLAADEMIRVLKPGGKLSAAVWDGPEKNSWVTAIMGVINKNMQLPAPIPGAPGMFRCSQPAVMKNIFGKAGFENVTEEPVIGKLEVGTAEGYWSMMTEVAAPIVAALGKADEAMQQRIKEEVYQIIHDNYAEGSVAIKAGSIVISASKPV